MHAGVGLHREHDLVDGAQDLVDLADAVFLSTYDRRVEIRDTLACVSLQTRSPSQSCISVPTGLDAVRRAFRSATTSAFAEAAAALAAAAPSPGRRRSPGPSRRVAA